MKRTRILAIVLGLLLFLPLTVLARGIDPVASTDWLEKNLVQAELVAIDIRKVEDYKAGHIPGAVNAFYGAWAIAKDGLGQELPADDDLRDVIGGAGIDPDSWVVVIGKTDTPSNRADIARVAWTLRFAGVENVAVLDGGYDKWIADKKAVSTDAVKPKATSYDGWFNREFLASKAYVIGRKDIATLVDVRAPEFFAGQKKLDFVARAGRIPWAVNLPVSLPFNADGTIKGKEALAALAAPVVGTDLKKEIIVYCDTGKNCAVWWFLLHEVLGYDNVRGYDGSMQEWAKDANAPMAP